VQTEAERTGGEVDGGRIRELFDQVYVSVPKTLELGGYDLKRDADRVRAEVALVGGERLSGQGRGVVEALVDAIARTFKMAVSVEAFDEMAIGEGTAARAMACVRLHANGSRSAGCALADDTTSAALQAVLAAAARIERSALRASAQDAPSLSASVP
jgi:2-isopropylmalate synthase